MNDAAPLAIQIHSVLARVAPAVAALSAHHAEH
ncbi:Uncharacterised protein [Vibrio cholerae]|nr:Uncharacterised protein [Vibrio cholerae]